MFVHAAAAVAAVISFVVPASLSPAPVASDREACLVEHGPDAAAACERAIRSGRVRLRELSDAYINRGQASYVKREYDGAIRDFDQAIRLDPAVALAYGNRANCHAMKKDYERALADYTRALALDDKYPSAYTGRGLLYEELGDIASARRDYLAAISAPLNYADGTWAQQVARERIAAFDGKLGATADATRGQK
jgi:tetratricopeptide (TPR) repeat protein